MSLFTAPTLTTWDMAAGQRTPVANLLQIVCGSTVARGAGVTHYKTGLLDRTNMVPGGLRLRNPQKLEARSRFSQSLIHQPASLAPGFHGRSCGPFAFPCRIHALSVAPCNSESPVPAMLVYLMVGKLRLAAIDLPALSFKHYHYVPLDIDVPAGSTILLGPDASFDALNVPAGPYILSMSAEHAEGPSLGDAGPLPD